MVSDDLSDNQSEYSVGSEEEDEDFDERPEGEVLCFLYFPACSRPCGRVADSHIVRGGGKGSYTTFIHIANRNK